MSSAHTLVEPAKAATESRWIQWFSWPANGQSMLADSADTLQLKGVPPMDSGLGDRTVVVLGLGAVGGPALCEFSRTGIGTLVGVDLDRYGEDSWVTQPIRRGLEQGRWKAEVQGARAHAINPAVHVITVKGLAQHVPYWVFHKADLIVIAADNLEVLVWVGTLAQALGKPLVQGAVHGESWLAILRRFDLSKPANAGPCCGLGQREWSMLRSRVGCDPSTLREQGIEPTRTLSCVCGTAANLLVAEALKPLFQIEQSLVSEELAYCLLSHKVWRTHIARNPACRCPHTQWNLENLPSAPDETTLATLVSLAAPKAVPPQVRAELPWASFTVCTGCGNGAVPVGRFARPGASLGACRCGEPLVVSPVGVRSVLPPGDLLRYRDLPLSQLGLGPGSAVGVLTGEQWTYFFVGSPELPTVPIAQAKEQRDV